jgi:tyrosine-protein kinase Etk/Wzc
MSCINGRLYAEERSFNVIALPILQYDHVIVDTASILAVTDASIVGQLAGATLMVLKAGAHPMREIELSVKRLKQSNVNLRGLLFNDMNVHSRRYGAGRYSYQYSY